eukprot:s886_g12.t1
MEHARSTLMRAEVVSNFEQGVSIPRCRQPGASDHISLRPTFAEARARYFWKKTKRQNSGDFSYTPLPEDGPGPFFVRLRIGSFVVGGASTEEEKEEEEDGDEDDNDDDADDDIADVADDDEGDDDGDVVDEGDADNDDDHEDSDECHADDDDDDGDDDDGGDGNEDEDKDGDDDGDVDVDDEDDDDDDGDDDVDDAGDHDDDGDAGAGAGARRMKNMTSMVTAKGGSALLGRCGRATCIFRRGSPHSQLPTLPGKCCPNFSGEMPGEPPKQRRSERRSSEALADLYAKEVNLPQQPLTARTPTPAEATGTRGAGDLAKSVEVEEAVYTAVFLDSESQQALMDFGAKSVPGGIPSEWMQFCDHMTICLGSLSNPKTPEDKDGLIAESLAARRAGKLKMDEGVRTASGVTGTRRECAGCWSGWLQLLQQIPAHYRGHGAGKQTKSKYLGRPLEPNRLSAEEQFTVKGVLQQKSKLSKAQKLEDGVLEPLPPQPTARVVLVRPDGKDTEGMLNDKATDSDGFRVACLQGIFVLQAWVVMKVERDQLDMHHMNSDLLPLLVHHGANCQEVARLDTPMDLDLVLLHFAEASKQQVGDLVEAASRHDEVVDLLLAAGAGTEVGADKDAASAAFGYTALMMAASEGHAEVVSLLLSAGADQRVGDRWHGSTALTLASSDCNVNVEILSLLLEAAGNDTADVSPEALLVAAQAGRVEVVGWLLQAGVADNVGEALRQASALGHAEVVRILPEAGAGKDAATDTASAILSASGAGHANVVSLLLEAGADKDVATTGGLTALILASLTGHVGVVSLLLEAEADKDAAEIAGYTALMWAAFQGHAEVVRLLLGAGADKDVADSSGFTALISAYRAGHADIVSLLLEAGAGKEIATCRQQHRPAVLKEEEIDLLGPGKMVLLPDMTLEDTELLETEEEPEVPRFVFRKTDHCVRDLVDEGSDARTAAQL